MNELGEGNNRDTYKRTFTYAGGGGRLDTQKIVRIRLFTRGRGKGRGIKLEIWKVSMVVNE